MPVDTKEEINQIQKKLEYIGLDLNNIPEFIKQYPSLEFRPSKAYGKENIKVYQYVDVREIEILLTPENRLNALEEKYKFAAPLYSYIEPKTEEDILRHTTFLKMLKEMTVEKLEIIAEEQKELNKKIPFKVKYDHNYLWQVFFDEATNKYFMLVTTEDKDYEAFFYLLKEQIKSSKSNKSHKIFVPVFYQYYENDFLKKSEIADMEKYLWLFTKDWPTIYKVYDKKNKISIRIVGNTHVYEKIKSSYNITFTDEEEIIKFYKLIKALFIMQTELTHYYQFETKISSNGGLEFLFNGRIIEYDNLSRLIKEESIKHKESAEKMQIEIEKLRQELEELNNECKQKEKEYLYKEKQIATYLECKKTFFGKIKYYFKLKKIKNTKEDNVSKEEEKKKEVKIEIFLEEKELYTIEDLIYICKKTDVITKKLKNIQLDIKAIKNKIDSITKKVDNATCYIKEIDSHKKSIFEFWKFTHKEEPLGLVAPEEQEKDLNPKLAKTFDYEEDIEELGGNWDKLQRNNFTKVECDTIYLASTNLLEYIQKENINEEELNKLKNQEQEETKLCIEEFDIFGAVIEDKTKIKTLANKKHRENKKNMWRILNINLDTRKEEVNEKIKNIKKELEKAIEKSNLLEDISIYIPASGKLDMNNIEIRIY